MEKITDEKYKKDYELLMEKKEQLLKLEKIDDLLKDGWIEKSEEKNIRVWQKQQDNVISVRSEGVMEVELERLLAGILDHEVRKGIDDKVEVSETIEKVNDQMNYNYLKMKGKLIVSGRDIVSGRLVSREDQKVVVVASSMSHVLRPQVKGVVRAHMHLSGWILTPQAQNTHAVYISALDPKGNIPTTIIKTKTKKVGMAIYDYQQYLNKHK